MLAADKLQLQSALKQQATALKEKEFNLHHSNFMTVGTQAAVLAGLDITMFIEFSPPEESSWTFVVLGILPGPWLARMIKVAYYAVIVGAFCANMIVVSQTTALSVLGAGLALRGPDGSMMTATEGLYEERRSVFRAFAIGLALTVGSVLLSVWLLLHWEAAMVCWFVTLWTSRKIYQNYRRIQQRMDFDENDTVDFTDIFQGPAAIRAVPLKVMNQVAKLGRSASAPVEDHSDSFHGGGGDNGNSRTSNSSFWFSSRNDNKRNNTGQSRQGGASNKHDEDDEEDEDDVESQRRPIVGRTPSSAASRRRRGGSTTGNNGNSS